MGTGGNAVIAAWAAVVSAPSRGGGGGGNGMAVWAILIVDSPWGEVTAAIGDRENPRDRGSK